MSAAELGKIGLLGASGSVGRLILGLLTEKGLQVRAQSRQAGRIAGGANVEEAIFDPSEATAYGDFVKDRDAVIWALGMSRPSATTLFSEGTRALLAAMVDHAVERLIVITGVGAGETRGHGGFLYNRLIYPLFTRAMYQDKDRQEALIAESALAWTILRPAPFVKTPPPGALQRHTEIAPGLQLRGITRSEVAEETVRTLLEGLYLRKKVFFGHA